ncbi:MAG: class I SAM-dependent methyltransferase [Planctomycetes bacterium]|nr:class I SAM-dependent methyltransferase [Planctomycetota bacterium]
MLSRVLEPEVMDSAEEAQDYNAMDHAEVNRRFVADLLEAAGGELRGDVLDLGTGTALIPIELCGACEDCRVVAVDLAAHMLYVARVNVELTGLSDRIRLDRIDAKGLPYEDGCFPVVISNSIVHHIPEPRTALAEAVRVAAPGGLLFLRDLMRPADDGEVARLVAQYAGGENDHARQMFADSLRAALTVNEVRGLVSALGFSPQSVEATSDRHWTWCARKAT